MSKAVIFVRVSTDKQHLESQESTLRTSAVADGFDESDIIYIGKKESGYKLDEDERQGLEELYKHIAKGDVDTVYIWELSRLSRKPKILYSVRDKLFEHKIQLKCLNPQFTLLDSDRTKYDNTANIIFSLFGALAEQEVIEKKERFRRGKKRLAEEGRYNGGAIPFGYRVDRERGNLIVVNEEEAAIVRELFNLYEKEGYSSTKIAKEFYARGYKQMTISYVNKILTNVHLTGIKVKSKNASYERQYPQIISCEQFKRCRDIARKNNTTTSKTRNIYYADRLITCTKCGSHWSSSGSKVCYHCYDAHNVHKKYNGYGDMPRCNNKTSITINVMDSLLWHLSKMLESQYIINSAQSDLDKLKRDKEILETKLSNVSSILDEIEEKKDKLREMYIDGLSKDRYDKRRKTLDDEAIDIRKKEVEYRKEKEHIEYLINSIISAYKLTKEEETDLITTNIVSILEELDNTKEDKIRSEIIHRHVKNVTVENITIEHKFNSFDEIRKTNARLISIESYLDGMYYYVYIPNEGLRGTMYTCNSNKEIISKTHYEYLNRYEDTSKKNRREKEKKEAYSPVQDYLRIEDVMKMGELKYNQVYGAIDRGLLKAQIIRHKCYIAPEDAKAYISKIKNEKKKRGDKISTFELAKRLGKDYLYVLRRVKKGQIASEYVDGSYLVSWDEAERYFSNEHNQVPKRNMDGKLTATEVAKKYSVSAKSVRKLLKDGIIPSYKQGGYYYIDPKDAEFYYSTK